MYRSITCCINLYVIFQSFLGKVGCVLVPDINGFDLDIIQFVKVVREQVRRKVVIRDIIMLYTTIRTIVEFKPRMTDDVQAFQLLLDGIKPINEPAHV